MKWFVFVVAILCFVSAGMYMFRKEMPFDFRIINLNGQLFIHNKTIWNKRNLQVAYRIGNKKGIATLDGKTNTAVIPGVIEGEPFHLKIYRDDLKGRIFYKPFNYEGIIHNPHKKYVVFIGASIGRDWQLEKLENRQKLPDDIAILFWPEYKFNKMSVIKHVLKIPIRPEIVFIKECAAYFPLDEKKAVQEVLDWCTDLKKAGIRTVAVTTVPVTRYHDSNTKKRADSIFQYNNMLRQRAEKVLDLAALLGAETDNHKFLFDKYASKDGLHVNGEAYQAMDKSLIVFFQNNE